jgi:hypothetical protein
MRYFAPAAVAAAALSCSASTQAEIVDVAPATACNYLAGSGLRTTTYTRQAEGGYRCVSPRINIGMVNNIAYHVAGDEKVPRTIGLTIVVDAPAEAAAVHRRLKDVAGMLARKLDCDLPATIVQAVTEGRGAQASAGKRRISVIRTTTSASGYTLDVLFE